MQREELKRVAWSGGMGGGGGRGGGGERERERATGTVTHVTFCGFE